MLENQRRGGTGLQWLATVSTSGLILRLEVGTRPKMVGALPNSMTSQSGHFLAMN